MNLLRQTSTLSVVAGAVVCDSFSRSFYPPYIPTWYIAIVSNFKKRSACPSWTFCRFRNASNLITFSSIAWFHSFFSLTRGMWGVSVGGVVMQPWGMCVCSNITPQSCWEMSKMTRVDAFDRRCGVFYVLGVKIKPPYTYAALGFPQVERNVFPFSCSLEWAFNFSCVFRFFYIETAYKNILESNQNNTWPGRWGPSEVHGNSDARYCWVWKCCVGFVMLKLQ
jgi:hypothetical protein